MKTSLIALAAALLVASPAVYAPARADTLIDNVNGVQVDRAGQVEHFSGVLVGNDGKVVRLLRQGDARPGRVEFRVDGGGRALLPGLIDAHGHVGELGLGTLQLDLTGTRSIAELQARLKAFSESHSTPRWVQGFGWNQEIWADKRFPTSADLEAVISDRPVWLVRVDGHAAVGNYAALKEAEITAATKTPAGGRIENGLFVDKARDLVEAKIPAALPAQRDQGLANAQALLLGYGLTAVADMGTNEADWNSMRRLGDAGRLQVRVMSYALGLEPLISIAGSKPTGWLYGDRLRMAGVKLYADGALGSRGAWLKAPYSDKPDTQGLQFMDDAKLKNLASRAAMDHFQIAIHAIGDAANSQVIAAYEELARTYGTDRRWRIEHAQILDPADIGRLAKAGIIASMQPTHQTSDDNMVEARLGTARLAGAYAWRSIAATGAHLAFGSDFPVESPNPFPGIAAAVSRADPHGQPPGGWRPQERVTLAQALAGFTREAAYAGLAEDRLGSLDPGMIADFIIVDRDITTATATDIAATKVLETWMAGRIVYRANASAVPAR